MSRGYVYLELRRTLRYGAPGARIPKNRASCTTRLARSRSPIKFLTASREKAYCRFRVCVSVQCSPAKRELFLEKHGKSLIFCTAIDECNYSVRAPRLRGRVFRAATIARDAADLVFFYSS